MEKTLCIIGDGTVSISPTITKITINFDKVLDTYKEALKESVKDANELKQIFLDLGFANDALKTARFDITTKYDRQYVNSKYIDIFKGYQYIQRFNIKFAKNNELLGKVLAKLANCLTNPKFSISYEIENPEAAIEEALRLAIKNVTNKANVIADAAGVKLVGIKEISYLDEKLTREHIMYDACCLSKSCSEDYEPDNFDVDFNPEDLSVNKKIEVTWEIQ